MEYMCYNAVMQTYLGTWQVSPTDGFWTDQEPSAGEAVLSAAVRMGITGFDTAQSYGRGRSEQVLGKVLRRFPGRQFCVDTKIMPTTRNLNDVLKSSLHNLSGVGIDCLYLHWPASGFDNASFLRQIAALKDEGLCRKTGVCNLPLDMLKEFVSSGLVIDRLQRPVSLLWTRELSETIGFCREHGIGVAAYSPTGMGLLSGKYRNPEDLSDARASLFCFRKECLGAFHDLLDVMEQTASRHGSSCTAVALEWVRHVAPDILILGARNKRQLEENLGGSPTLTDSELSDLETAAFELEKTARGICGNIFSYDW